MEGKAESAIKLTASMSSELTEPEHGGPYPSGANIPLKRENGGQQNARSCCSRTMMTGLTVG
jgi:hypothetical protein